MTAIKNLGFRRFALFRATARTVRIARLIYDADRIQTYAGTVGTFGGRIGEESFSIVGPFHNAAIFKQDHLVGDGTRELHFMRHDQHGLAGIGEFEHHVEHFAHHLRIERGGDLVEQQHFRMQDQRTADGHALALAAGQLVRPGILAIGKADAFQKPDRLLLDCGLISLLHQGRRQCDVAKHGLLGNRS